MSKAPSPSVYEKLGAFYLGREYDLGQRKLLADPILYDSKDLTTHAVCVGMTGSGKTGLCIGLLEEAALDGIPAIVIDPKGDIANLMLTFPGLKPKDFEPWVDAGAAQRKGMGTKEYAASQAKLWKNGLKEWGQDGKRIKALRDAVDMTIYTPGSSAGVGLTPLQSFEAPGAAVIADSEALRDRVSSSVSGLLTLVGIKSDPMQSPEHILLSTILERAWRDGRGVDLGSLIPLIQNPPFDRIGVLDVDTFMPAKARMTLAIKLNNLLASPEFASWLEGEPLNIHNLLYTKEGKPRISILSIAHLSESERMFFVTLVLSEMVAWMRTQSGTSSLRALMYMDEVFGYLPPIKNPPSKKPLLTMMKQARAYGVGVVLATQNPVDLDYKGLSNAGTWFLGRVQTERDKKRVLEGLEGAASSQSSKFDRRTMDKMLSGLGKRVFLMHNVHEDGPVVFHTRWAMSYLRGPLTRIQIAQLMKSKKAASKKEMVPKATPQELPTVLEAAQKSASHPPVLGAGIPIGYLPMIGALAANEQLCYAPALCADASMHYVRVSSKVDQWNDVRLLTMLDDAVGTDPWGESFEIPVQSELYAEPDVDGAYEPVPPKASRKASYKSWATRAKAHLYRQGAMSVWKCKVLKAYSQLGEDEGAFRVRLRDTLREHRDEKLDALRRKYGTKVESLKKKIIKAEQKIDVEKSQYKSSRISTAASFGATILGALLGRKIVSATSVRSAGTAASRASKTAKERGDIGRAEDNLCHLHEQLAALEAQFESELDEIRDEITVEGLYLEETVLSPRKTEMGTCEVWLVWVPVGRDPNGRRRLMIEI
ncbi:MAG: ATP-binding protein [Phycisphaerales bacterium]|nr:ATP-binding protein [Phycisphaerales bacterium]